VSSQEQVRDEEPALEPPFITHLRVYRDAVIREMQETIARRRFHRVLAGRLAEYPLRAGKGLRPALCLATCQAFGGLQESATPSAVALELFHNAFLVHDDVEDESIHRRGSPSMHQTYGTAIAINVGDALNVLSMTPLLDNLRVVGLEKTMRIFFEIERMARESVEGQAMELDWVRAGDMNLSDRHYFLMTTKKTCWYTCIAPCRIGALIAIGANADLDMLQRFGRSLGIAFQIQDDVLNLVAEEERYGKETAGDIWEGKRTLMLLHLVRSCSPSERERVTQIMRMARSDKSQEEVDYIFQLMIRYGSIEYARRISRRYAVKARTIFDQGFANLRDTSHKEFLREAIQYVIERDL
jgi:geranylgeranyl diphosphate synthase type II